MGKNLTQAQANLRGMAQPLGTLGPACRFRTSEPVRTKRCPTTPWRAPAGMQAPLRPRRRLPATCTTRPSRHRTGITTLRTLLCPVLAACSTMAQRERPARARSKGCSHLLCQVLFDRRQMPQITIIWLGILSRLTSHLTNSLCNPQAVNHMVTIIEKDDFKLKGHYMC